MSNLTYLINKYKTVIAVGDNCFLCAFNHNKGRAHEDIKAITYEFTDKLKQYSLDYAKLFTDDNVKALVLNEPITVKFKICSLNNELLTSFESTISNYDDVCSMHLDILQATTDFRQHNAILSYVSCQELSYSRKDIVYSENEKSSTDYSSRVFASLCKLLICKALNVDAKHKLLLVTLNDIKELKFNSVSGTNIQIAQQNNNVYIKQENNVVMINSDDIMLITQHITKQQYD